MRRMALVVLATLGLVVPNIVADETNPPQPATPAPATSPAPAQPKAPALDPGQQKLTRRERKERIKNLSDQWREFLQDVWLPEVEANRRPGTLKTYRAAVDRHIIPALGEVRLAERSGGRAWMSARQSLTRQDPR